MVWHADVCRKAPGGDKLASDQTACWELFLNFIHSLADYSLALIANGQWQGDASSPLQGLRISIVAFKCHSHQTVPVVNILGENLNSQASFNAALENALTQFIPDGGTCPGLAIDTVVQMIDNDPLKLQRPLKAAVLLSDGIFYDGTWPQKAALGLEHFCVQTYALALPGGQRGQNLSPSKRQIKEFGLVTGNSAHVYNFGLDGYNLLATFANNVVYALDTNPITSCFAALAKQPFWCGYTEKSMCDQSIYCKYPINIQPTGCFNNDYCGFKEAQCNMVEFCYWHPRQGCRLITN